MSSRRRRPPLIAFLGPSLPAAEARRLGADLVLPPARQGDVWRALALRPSAIALVDGVFESTPSVWHHELLDALDAGVPVFGGGSMGALRAAELGAHGMIGVGWIHDAYRRGVLRGDDEVALLHGDADSGYRPLTVPLVTVRVVASELARERILSRAHAARLVEAAAAIFYQDRTWPRVLSAARLPAEVRARVRGRLRDGVPDPKAEDARATVRAAAQLVAGVRRGGSPPGAGTDQGAAAATVGRSRRPSALVRRRKLLEGRSVVAGAALSSGTVLAALRRAPDRAALRDDGLRRLLLVGLARALGLQATHAERDAAADDLFSRLGVPRPRRVAFLAASGLDGADAARLFEDLAVERKLLERAQAAVPDGPSPDEGLALASRLAGRWADTAAALHDSATPRRRRGSEDA